MGGEESHTIFGSSLSEPIGLGILEGVLPKIHLEVSPYGQRSIHTVRRLITQGSGVAAGPTSSPDDGMN